MHGLWLVSMSLWMTNLRVVNSLPNWIEWDKSKGRYVLKSGESRDKH